MYINRDELGYDDLRDNLDNINDQMLIIKLTRFMDVESSDVRSFREIAETSPENAPKSLVTRW